MDFILVLRAVGLLKFYLSLIVATLFGCNQLDLSDKSSVSCSSMPKEIGDSTRNLHDRLELI